MRADTVSLIDKLAREHRLKKKEYLALLENASVEEHVHAATLADKERRRIYGTEVFIRGLIEVGTFAETIAIIAGSEHQTANVYGIRSPINRSLLAAGKDMK